MIPEQRIIGREAAKLNLHWADALEFHQEALELRRQKLGPNG
jgi:hypothetical protein